MGAIDLSTSAGVDRYADWANMTRDVIMNDTDVTPRDQMFELIQCAAFARRMTPLGGNALQVSTVHIASIQCVPVSYWAYYWH